jgi:lycopene beta-cyclase
MAQAYDCDVAILGGGLAGSLIALALHRYRSDLKLRLIEADDRIGGDHIWSFFESDIAKDHRRLVAPLVGHSWPAYDVAFPGYRRTVTSAYHSILSERLDAHVRSTLPHEALILSRRITAATPTTVTLDNGDKIEALGVIDARGAGRLPVLDCGWQKFVGHELQLEEPHGLEHPIIMDATVEQIDGYRFVYVLPFAPDRLFIEDTYYSSVQAIDNAAVSRRIAGYALEQGWKPTAIVREEQGALPVVMGGDFNSYWRSGGDGRAKAGVRAGLFHPTTSYSLPDAVRTAMHIASLDDLSGVKLEREMHDYAHRRWKERGFYRMLDRMLFRAAEPDQRYKVLERFYRLDKHLIARFYAARSTTADKARILMGKPPVPIGRALSVMFKG